MNLRSMYRTMLGEEFPRRMDIVLHEGEERQVLSYEKTTWDIGGETLGLRYGENPDQPAALYRLCAGNLSLGDVRCISPDLPLASLPELLQSGKHPSKINITDVDSALNVLKYFPGTPCAVIVKHNNPCGVALGSSVLHAFERAYLADRVAAFGGALAVNAEIDLATAEALAENYLEVVAAPEFAPGVMGVFEKKKNLRVMRIANMRRLSEYGAARFLEFKSLMDGGVVLQWSFRSAVRSEADFLPASCEYKGKNYEVGRRPSAAELADMLFGWLVETGITSNSVIYVKNGVTVGIGTGEQDRVGVAEIARDKAYRKLADRLAWERWKTPWNLLDDRERRAEIEAETADLRGGLRGSVMVSDAFFPFRDGVEVGLREGVTAVVQPGGSLRDHEVIEACNEYGAAMLFTGQRCFRH